MLKTPESISLSILDISKLTQLQISFPFSLVCLYFRGCKSKYPLPRSHMDRDRRKSFGHGFSENLLAQFPFSSCFDSRSWLKLEPPSFIHKEIQKYHRDANPKPPPPVSYLLTFVIWQVSYYLKLIILSLYCLKWKSFSNGHSR